MYARRLSRCLAMPLFALCGHTLAESVNWTSTVGEPIAALEQKRFRYDLDLRTSARKSAPDCAHCPAVTAFQLDAEQRLEQRLQHTYRRLGEDLAARLWDDPRGRRIRFDVDGRPGLGLLIPLD